MFTWDLKWTLPETKFQFIIKEIQFTLLFIADEMKRISFRGWPEINGPLSKIQSFLFTHVQMFPSIWFHFRGSVYMRFYHSMTATSFISGCIMQAVTRNWRDTEMRIFHFARNEISCKHSLNIINIFSLFHCLNTRSICILVKLLLEYSNSSNKRRIQRSGAY